MVLDNISASIEEMNATIDSDFQGLTEKMEQLLNAVNKLIELQTMQSKYTMQLNDNIENILVDYNMVKQFLMNPQVQQMIGSFLTSQMKLPQPIQQGSE